MGFFGGHSLKIHIIGIFAATLFGSGRAGAEVLDERVLEQIQDSVVLICGEFVQSGSSEVVNVDGAVSAELVRLGRLLADAGVSGEVNYNASEYFGVLREELGFEIQDNRACRLRVWNDIFSRNRDSDGRDARDLAAEASRFAEGSGLFQCKATQLLELCVDSVRIRGKYADLSLSLTNTTEEPLRVCLPNVPAYAVSSAGEKVVNKGTECRDIVPGGLERYAFDFEFTNDVGSDFDVVVNFNRPKTDFSFRGLH